MSGDDRDAERASHAQLEAEIARHMDEIDAANNRWRSAKAERDVALARIATLEEALLQAEACMTIVEPRSDKAEYIRILGVLRAALADAPEEKPSANVLDAILTSDIDEALMRSTLLRCYGARHHGFHMSVEHYRYLAEQIIALRVHIKRAASAALADAPEGKP